MTRAQLAPVRRGDRDRSSTRARRSPMRHAANSSGAMLFPDGAVRSGAARHRDLRQRPLGDRWCNAYAGDAPRQRSHAACARSSRARASATARRGKHRATRAWRSSPSATRTVSRGARVVTRRSRSEAFAHRSSVASAWTSRSPTSPTFPTRSSVIRWCCSVAPRTGPRSAVTSTASGQGSPSTRSRAACPSACRERTWVSRRERAEQGRRRADEGRWYAGAASDRGRVREPRARRASAGRATAQARRSCVRRGRQEERQAEEGSGSAERRRRGAHRRQGCGRTGRAVPRHGRRTPDPRRARARVAPAPTIPRQELPRGGRVHRLGLAADRAHRWRVHRHGALAAVGVRVPPRSTSSRTPAAITAKALVDRAVARAHRR